MEAFKLQTLADPLVFPEERVELIGGEIVRRPMARFAHGRAQGCTFRHLGAFDSGSGPGGGWWIATEISVAYEAHECPSHDLAGWRRARLPRLPDGVIDLPPDWVCEIVSPGHEHKDTRLLMRSSWIWPICWGLPARNRGRRRAAAGRGSGLVDSTGSRHFIRRSPLAGDVTCRNRVIVPTRRPQAGSYGLDFSRKSPYVTLWSNKKP